MQDELPSNSFDALFAKARCAVALQDSDSKSLELSASGGAFALFARSVLRVGGAVFGASLIDNGTVRHICIKRIDDLYKLQGSKYVKSNVADTYEECAHLLCKNTVVLYSGTPCQIAGLRKYLKKQFQSKSLQITCFASISSVTEHLSRRFLLHILNGLPRRAKPMTASMAILLEAKRWGGD